MKIKLGEKQPAVDIRDYSYFIEYIKLMGMVLFGISLTTPVLALVLFDVDTEIAGDHQNLVSQLIWDKPILPYVAGFLILMIQWFKFVEVNHYLKTTNLNHILITFGFFFFLCLYPYFEMNIEFTSDQPHSRAIFSVAWGLVGIFQYWQLAYADKSNLLKSEMSAGRIQAVKREVIADPIVAVICIGLSYTNLLIWITGMVLLVPLVNVLVARISIQQGH